MIKKIPFTLLAVIPLLACCSKQPEISDHPFTIGIKSVQSQAVWADIVPENNDFNYNYGTVSVKEFDEKYKTDEALIQAKDKADKEYWEKNLKEQMSFRDAFLCKGAYFLKGTPLEPETEYYVYAFPYDNNDNPICKVSKQKFKTTEFIPSDIDFTVTLTGSVISVVPSNNDDSYYFDYETVETVDKNFKGSPSLFYEYLIYKYEEYGFMSELACKGPIDSDMADYLKLKPQQELYLVGSGYNNGVNAPYRFFKLTYAGEGLPGKVERL